MMYFFLLGRVLLGGYFIKNGLGHFQHLEGSTGYAKSKNVPMPKTAVMATGLMLILGGLGVLLGIYVKISVLLLSVFLFAVSFKMHRYWEVADPAQKMSENINFYKNLGLLGAVLMLLAIPLPWVLSLM